MGEDPVHVLRVGTGVWFLGGTLTDPSCQDTVPPVGGLPAASRGPTGVPVLLVEYGRVSDMLSQGLRGGVN